MELPDNTRNSYKFRTFVAALIGTTAIAGCSQVTERAPKIQDVPTSSQAVESKPEVNCSDPEEYINYRYIVGFPARMMDEFVTDNGGIRSDYIGRIETNVPKTSEMQVMGLYGTIDTPRIEADQKSSRLSQLTAQVLHESGFLEAEIVDNKISDSEYDDRETAGVEVGVVATECEGYDEPTPPVNNKRI